MGYPLALDGSQSRGLKPHNTCFVSSAGWLLKPAYTRMLAERRARLFLQDHVDPQILAEGNQSQRHKNGEGSNPL